MLPKFEKLALLVKFTLMGALSVFFSNLHPLTFTGSLKGPKGKLLNGYVIFFNGYKTTTDTQGRFQIHTTIDPSQEPIYFLASSGVEWSIKPNTGTVSLARQNPKKPYKLYSIRIAQSEPEHPAEMHIHPESLENKNFEIPIDKCIIMPINPNQIERLEIPKQISYKGFFNLPSIILADEEPLKKLKTRKLTEKNVDENTIKYKVNNIGKRARDKAILKSLDWNLFHEDVDFQTTKKKNRANKTVEITLYSKT